MEDLKKSIIDDSNASYETEYMRSTIFFQILSFPINISMVKYDNFFGITSQLNRSQLLFFHQLWINYNTEA